MSELSTIQNSKKPNTKNSLYSDLKEIGVKEKDILLIHSSLSSIGWVCGGEVAVVEALLKAVGEEGTICMPAQTGDISDPAEWSNPPVPKEWMEEIYKSMPPFRKDITPTRGMGRIAELFRKYPGTLRSNHPQVSFCAKGRFADEVIKEHSLTPQFGMKTPLGKLYQSDAKVLLLGVGYQSCTCFHMGEVLCGKTAITRLGTMIAKDPNERTWIWFDDYEYNSDDFIELGKAFEHHGKITKGKIGNAECRLFKIKDGIDFAEEWLTQNRTIAKES